MQRHPELRWLLSLAVIVAAAIAIATTVSGVFRNDSTLPATSPDQVTDQARTAYTGGYSGTVTTHVDLGLPALITDQFLHAVPAGGSLLRGTHQLKYWYGSATKQRVAVIGGQGREQDVFRNGAKLLFWDTASRTAQQATLDDADQLALPLTVATPAAMTPPQLADRILDLAGTATDTTLRSGPTVANQPTYELLVRPSAADSRVDLIRIQVDGRTMVPLGVQVFGRDADQPTISAVFTSITYTAPAERNFDFTPPAGVHVREATSFGVLSGVLSNVHLEGDGWDTLAVYDAGKDDAAVLEQLLGDQLRAVKGTWGRGRLLESPLVCVLITNTGRIEVGAVDPEVLYRAAS